MTSGLNKQNWNKILFPQISASQDWKGKMNITFHDSKINKYRKQYSGSYSCWIFIQKGNQRGSVSVIVVN
jgi:hypothetical protein